MIYKGAMMALTHDKQLQMRVSDEFLRSIDEWRRGQPDLPPRAEAIRRLIAMGLGKPAAGPSGSGSGSARKPRSTSKSAGRAR